MATYFHTEVNNEDLIIALAELSSFLLFLLLDFPSLEHKLVAYSGDNSNVITRLSTRKSNNHWARYFLRLLARAEQIHMFRVYPMYISTLNNIDCDNLTRLSDEEILELARIRNWKFLDTQTAIQ